MTIPQQKMKTSNMLNRYSKEERVEIYLLGIYEFSTHDVFRCTEHGPYSKKIGEGDHCIYCQLCGQKVSDADRIAAKKILGLI